MEVVRTLKVSGVNAQVSWNPEVSAWVISSNSVSLVALGKKDVAVYTEDERYALTAKVANCWFNLIKLLNKKELSSLKAAITNKTMVGEFVS